MNKQTKIITLIVVLVVIGVALYFVFYKISAPFPQIKLTSDKLITNQTIIDLILLNQTSPNGNLLTELVLQDDFKVRGIFDGVYKVAYFTCSNNEHQGWIYYSHGGISKLYGPYAWCLI